MATLFNRWPLHSPKPNIYMDAWASSLPTHLSTSVLQHPVLLDHSHMNNTFLKRPLFTPHSHWAIHHPNSLLLGYSKLLARQVIYPSYLTFSLATLSWIQFIQVLSPSIHWNNSCQSQECATFCQIQWWILSSHCTWSLIAVNETFHSFLEPILLFSLQDHRSLLCCTNLFLSISCLCLIHAPPECVPGQFSSLPSSLPRGSLIIVEL